MLFWKAFLASEESLDAVEERIAAIRYQMTRFLESEAPLVAWSERLKHVECSNMRFGLDCIQSISSQMDKTRFSRQLEGWLKAFEPRLSNIRVEAYEHDEGSNLINFSVLAHLNTEQGRHALVFDSNISLANQKADVGEQEFV